MLFSEYLHEKTEESRHNENVGYFITTIGTILLTTGLTQTIITNANPAWLLIIPITLTPNPTSLMATTLTVIGITLLIFGIARSIHYARTRSWYIKELNEAHSTEEKQTRLDRKTEKPHKEKT